MAITLALFLALGNLRQEMQKHSSPVTASINWLHVSLPATKQMQRAVLKRQQAGRTQCWKPKVFHHSSLGPCLGRNGAMTGIPETKRESYKCLLSKFNREVTESTISFAVRKPSSSGFSTTASLEWQVANKDNYTLEFNWKQRGFLCFCPVRQLKGWRCNLVVECFPILHKALGTNTALSS